MNIPQPQPMLDGWPVSIHHSCKSFIGTVHVQMPNGTFRQVEWRELRFGTLSEVESREPLLSAVQAAPSIHCAWAWNVSPAEIDPAQAAAPDLLAACRRALPVLLWAQTEQADGREDYFDSGIAVQVQRAIAKATARTPERHEGQHKNCRPCEDVWCAADFAYDEAGDREMEVTK